MTTQITNHVAQAKARLKEQFKEKTKYVALLEALVAPCQDIEDALWQLFSERWIDTAVGDQLDNLGTVIGQDRAGLSDDNYRAYLRARIAANKSNGTVEDLIRITELIVNDEAAHIVVEQQFPAAVVVKVEDAAASVATSDALIAFLKLAKAAGVRVILEYWGHATEPFSFAKSTFLNGSHASGLTTLTVDSTAGFPEAGSLYLAQGTALAETRAYTGKTATTFTGITALTNTHADNTQVAWADSPGLGWKQGYFSVAKD